MSCLIKNPFFHYRDSKREKKKGKFDRFLSGGDHLPMGTCFLRCLLMSFFFLKCWPGQKLHSYTITSIKYYIQIHENVEQNPRNVEQNPRNCRTKSIKNVEKKTRNCCYVLMWKKWWISGHFLYNCSMTTSTSDTLP